MLVWASNYSRRPRIHWLKWQIFISHNSGSWKSKNRISAWSDSQWELSSSCVLIGPSLVWAQRKSDPVPSLLFIRALIPSCSLGISNFLEEISSLSHSVVFLYFFALIAEEGFLISPCYSLELCIQMLISFLVSFDFRFSSFHSYLQGLLIQPFCFFFHFFSMGIVLIPVSCTMSWTSIHSSSGTLSDLVP